MSEKKINAAVIGVGEMGLTHLKAAIDSSYVSTVIGFDPDKKRSKELAHKYDIKMADSLEEVLGNPLVDIVYIASPNEFHCLQTIKSLEAGKAVLCEKPMANTLKDAQLILEVQKRTGNFYQSGLEARYSKLYVCVKNWIDSGLIGVPLKSICNYYCSEFHLKDTWRSRSDNFFLIGEKLSHYLDLPRWWFNDEVLDVYSVSSPNFVNYFNHPDNHTIICKFNGGAISTLNFVMGTASTFDGDPLTDPFAMQADDGHKLTCLVYGTKGVIEADVFNRRIRRWEFGDSPQKLTNHIVETLTFEFKDDSEWFHNVYGQDIIVSELVAKKLPPFITQNLI